MQLLNGKIRLNDLANSLGITSSAVRQHLTNKSPLGKGAQKLDDRLTSDYLLSIDSVLQFLDWLVAKGRKVSYATIDKTRAEIKKLI